MDKRDTLALKITKDGKRYNTKDKRRERIEEVFSYARDTMTSPCAFHFITHIHDAELFRATKSKGIIKEFKRALKRQYKLLAKKEGKGKAKRPQKCPNTLIVYSIEYKLTSQKEIDGNGDAYKYGYEKTKEKLPFLHMHVHVIADCNNTIAPNFTFHAMNAMNELDGLKATRYAKTKPRKTKNESGEYEYEEPKKYKKLNSDFDDAVLRAFYLTKIEQKSPEIPYRKTFDTSKVDKEYKAG